MNPIDLSLLRWFNGLVGRNPALDAGIALLTQYAPLFFLALFARYFFCGPTEPRSMRRQILLAGLSGVVALALSVAIGSLVYRARPFVAMPDQVHLLIPHALDSSFPSDHAAGSAAFAVGMWQTKDRSARWLFTITALVVGLSRVVAGVHWPSDILVSFLLGGLSARLVFAFERPLAPLLDGVIRVVEGVERRFHR